MKRSNIGFSHHLRRAGTLILAQPNYEDGCINVKTSVHLLLRCMSFILDTELVFRTKCIKQI
ncbi:MAG: hypothetical protein ACFB02_09930 [Mastigocoleus sp.]